MSYQVKFMSVSLLKLFCFDEMFSFLRNPACGSCFILVTPPPCQFPASTRTSSPLFGSVWTERLNCLSVMQSDLLLLVKRMQMQSEVGSTPGKPNGNTKSTLNKKQKEKIDYKKHVDKTSADSMSSSGSNQEQPSWPWNIKLSRDFFFSSLSSTTSFKSLVCV